MSNYVTAIGLDVHARSIKACALNPMTGEVERASFGYDPASVAEWALGFESPKAVYESGVTGFHLCRALRALGLDCAVGAVSKMQRPAADRGRKTDRRDAEFLARLLATRNVVEVWVPDGRTEAARDLSRALADARDDLQRAKQRMSKFLLRHGHVFDEPTPAGGRRGNWTRAYVSVNLFFTSFAKQARRSRKGGFTGCANVFSPIPVTAWRGRPSAGPSACRTCRLS